MSIAIEQVTKEFMDDAVAKMTVGDKNLPYGLFWTGECGRYVAMDATSNELYMEDFDSYGECVLWLLEIIDQEGNLTIDEDDSDEDDYDEDNPKEWFEILMERLPDEPKGDMWASGGQILCCTDEIADDIADFIEHLYYSHGEEVFVNVGYYDPEEDTRSEEVDRFTGWWYVDII